MIEANGQDSSEITWVSFLKYDSVNIVIQKILLQCLVIGLIGLVLTMSISLDVLYKFVTIASNQGDFGWKEMFKISPRITVPLLPHHKLFVGFFPLLVQYVFPNFFNVYILWWLCCCFFHLINGFFLMCCCSKHISIWWYDGQLVLFPGTNQISHFFPITWMKFCFLFKKGFFLRVLFLGFCRILMYIYFFFYRWMLGYYLLILQLELWGWHWFHILFVTRLHLQ